MNATASIQKLREVVELGVSSGVWTVVSTAKPYADDADSTWRFVDVETPSGLRFSIHSGGWGKANKISCSIAGIQIDDELRVWPSDVKSYREVAAPEANVSADKPASQILKDLQRRIINEPISIERATRVKERVASLLASRSGLSAHIATMKALGFQFRDDAEKQTHSADSFGNGLYKLTVYENGRVNFETSTNIANMPAILASLKGSK